MNLILLKTLPGWLIIDTVDRYVILLMATLMNKRARNFLQRSFFPRAFFKESASTLKDQVRLFVVRCFTTLYLFRSIYIYIYSYFNKGRPYTHTHTYIYIYRATSEFRLLTSDF